MASGKRRVHLLKGALILAGGKSTRFGTDKAQAELGGRPLIAHVLRAASRVAGEVVVAIGRESCVDVYDKLLPSTAHIVKDRLRVKSPLVGILTGFQIMKSEYSIVLSCDIPFVKLSYDDGFSRWNAVNETRRYVSSNSSTGRPRQ